MIKQIKISSTPPYIGDEQKIDAKQINFLFGLNGTGKTTISRFLRSQDDSRRSQGFLLPERRHGSSAWVRHLLEPFAVLAHSLSRTRSLDGKSRTIETSHRQHLRRSQVCYRGTGCGHYRLPMSGSTESGYDGVYSQLGWLHSVLA